MENHAALCEELMAQGANSDLRIPPDGPLVASFANAGVAQLLAYDVALEKGTDVDQPRNLAKSVTVE